MNRLWPRATAMFRLMARVGLVLVVVGFCKPAYASEILPPLAQIKGDHPRVLLRPKSCPWAISLGELRSFPTNKDALALLAQLRGEKSASAQAMVWLLTGESAAAERALGVLRNYRMPGEVDTFHVYFTLTQLALAYDWLHGYAGFTAEVKAEVRSRVLPLAQRGLKFTDDHMFHNYIWMSAGGVALWALATAGDDAEASQLYERIRQRFNSGLFPAWKYLDGLPSEPMGYWALYVLSPGVLTLLGAQSAFETNLAGLVENSDGNWLNRHFENLIQSTLPDMRYIPWGDLQGGPNGGVTYDMAGIIDALTWATQSPQGAYFSQWLANKRGLRRFRAETGIYYFLYTQRLKRGSALPSRELPLTPTLSPSDGERGNEPALSFLAGNSQSGHFIARSGWDDGATIVTLRATDHFGDHHHYDQGSFIIYRNGLLAVDPPVYQKVRGPQQRTEVHNALLLDGQGQRPVRGQWFKTVEEFQKNLTAGRELETGDILFWKEAGGWAAVAGQFAQAYAPGQVQSCARQMLFVRPGKIVIVDQLTAPAGRPLPEAQWLLQMPKAPVTNDSSFWTSYGKSWMRCRPLWPGGSAPVIESTPVNTYRASLRYRGNSTLKMVHLLETGDGLEPEKALTAKVRTTADAVELTLGQEKFLFSSEAPFTVRRLE